MSSNVSINIHNVIGVSAKASGKNSHWVSLFIKDETGAETEITIFTSVELSHAIAGAIRFVQVQMEEKSKCSES